MNSNKPWKTFTFDSHIAAITLGCEPRDATQMEIKQGLAIIVAAPRGAHIVIPPQVYLRGGRILYPGHVPDRLPLL